MDKYPAYLSKEPKPLVFLTGIIDNEPDIHTRIIRAIENSKEIDQKDTMKLTFKSVPPDYVYPEKKLPKDVLNCDGIMKGNWPSKHFESIPSVLIMTFAFSQDCSSNEWIRREGTIYEKYIKIKNILNPREIKIIVILFKVGLGAMEKDVMDDRISSLKKHLQIDSKTFLFISPSELNVLDSINIKKLSKSTKEFSIGYYTYHIKRFKTIQKSIIEKYKGISENILIIRYNFKIAYLYEFQIQNVHSLKYYRQCYQAIISNIESLDEDFLEQQKTLAEIVNFKICFTLLRNNIVVEAFQQFKNHMSKFINIFSGFTWKHYAWVSDQYVVFVQLLELFAINDALPDADRSYYYHNAARYSQKRQASFDIVKKDVEKKMLEDNINGNSSLVASTTTVSSTLNTYKGYILLPPLYLGSPPQLLNPILAQVQPNSDELLRIYQDYVKEIECKVNHNTVIMNLLRLALDRNNPNFKRKKAFIQSLIAMQYNKEDQPSLALNYFYSATEYLLSEGWITPSIPLLSNISQCAVTLGKPVDYLNANLILYANFTESSLSRLELENIHLNMMTLFRQSILQQSEDVTTEGGNMMRNPSYFITSQSTFKPIFDTFNEAISSNPVGKCCLPMGHTIDMSSRLSRMFDIVVNFDKPTVQLGSVVQVTINITSRFIDDMIFDEMRIHFLDDCIVKNYLHHNPSADSKPVDEVHSDDNLKKIYTNLTFPVKKSIEFSFPLYLSELQFSRYLLPDAILCVERIEFIWKKASRQLTHMNGEQSSDEMETVDGLIMDVSLFPDSVLKLKKSPGKSMPLKDIIKYCCGGVYPMIIIQKPQAQVRLLHPNSYVTITTPASGSNSSSNQSFTTSSITTPNGMNSTPPAFPLTSTSSVSNATPEIAFNITTENKMEKEKIECKEVFLLCGLMQRIDLKFNAGEFDLLNCHLHLSASPPSIVLPLNLTDPTHDESAAISSSPPSSSPLFWYPDKQKIKEIYDVFIKTKTNLSVSDQEREINKMLDSIPFHPISLNSSMQPAHSIFVADCITADSEFSVPIFLNYDSLHDVTTTIRIKIEYVPRGTLRSSIYKEFNILVRLHCPFQLKFFLSPLHNVIGFDPTNCVNALVEAASNKSDRSTIMGGDMFLLTANIKCSKTFKYPIQISGLKLNMDLHATWYHKQISSSDDGKLGMFELLQPVDCQIENSGEYDLLDSFIAQLDPSNVNGSKRGRLIVTQGDVLDTYALIKADESAFLRTLHTFNNISSPPNGINTSPSFVNPTSNFDVEGHLIYPLARVVPIGSIQIEWKTMRRHILRPLLNYHTNHGLDPSGSTLETSLNLSWLKVLGGKNFPMEKKSNKSNKVKRQPSETNRQDEEKLLSIDELIGKESKCVDQSIVNQSISSLRYIVPDIQVQIPPFDLNIECPPTAKLNELLSIRVSVRSKMNSSEKVNVSVVLNEAFLITGMSSASFDVPSTGSVDTLFTLYPLRSGLINIPHVTLSWESNRNSTLFSKILDIGDRAMNRKSIFVYP